jgi:hypothetical protein
MKEWLGFAGFHRALKFMAGLSPNLLGAMMKSSAMMSGDDRLKRVYMYG